MYLKSSYKNKNILRWLFLFLTFAFIILIWWNSFQNANDSTEISQGLLKFIKQFFQALHINASITEHILRKLAHLTEFAVLGVLLTLDVMLWLDFSKIHLLIPLLVGLLVALTDETIQRYTFGRSSSVIDVWIDFSGIVIATVIVFMIYKFHKK